MSGAQLSVNGQKCTLTTGWHMKAVFQFACHIEEGAEADGRILLFVSKEEKNATGL
jgi:hypothetical protein